MRTQQYRLNTSANDFAETAQQNMVTADNHDNAGLNYTARRFQAQAS